MADEKDPEQKPQRRINDRQRFSYIGFEVFPNEPKELFKNDEEKESLIGALRKKRATGQVIRDDCKLLEERVSASDRIVLTIVSVIILGALFLPWYSLHNEIIEESKVSLSGEPIAAVADSSLPAMTDDSATLMALDQSADSTGMVATGDSLTMAAMSATSDEQTMGEKHEKVATTSERDRVRSHKGDVPGEELLTSYVPKKKITREYERMSGLGSMISVASIAPRIFSSGMILIVTAIVFLIYLLMCIGLPAYTLYGLYGTKGDADTKALKLKEILRTNWWPVLLFLFAAMISFVGANYGFDSVALFTSLGRSYSVGVFLGSLSWGIFISMAAFILLAVKGIEI